MATNFVAEAWACLAIALIIVILRLYFRFFTGGIKGMGLDDLLMVGAALCYAMETATAWAIAVFFEGYANNNITPEARAQLSPDSEEWTMRVRGSKGHIVGWFTYTGVMWLLKGCWIVYYSRMTDGVDNMHIRIRVGTVIIVVTYLAAVCMILFKCWPLSRQWQIYPDPGNNCQPGFSKLQVSFVMALNTFTDLYLMAIPLPMIFRSRMNLKRKILLSLLFSGGFLTMVFGILRCVTLVTVGATEPSESGQWSVRETFVAVLVSNAPHVFPLFRIWAGKVEGYGSAAIRRTGRSTCQESYRLGSRSGADGTGSKTPKGRNKKRFLHPLSLPNETAWQSDDAIVTVQGKQESNDHRSEVTEESSAGQKAHVGGSLNKSDNSRDRQHQQGLSSPFASRKREKHDSSGTAGAGQSVLVQREWHVSAEDSSTKLRAQPGNKTMPSQRTEAATQMSRNGSDSTDLNMDPIGRATSSVKLPSDETGGRPWDWSGIGQWQPLEGDEARVRANTTEIKSL